MALAFAPLSDSMRTKFFLPMVKGQIVVWSFECFEFLYVWENNPKDYF